MQTQDIVVYGQTLSPWVPLLSGLILVMAYHYTVAANLED